MKALVYKSTGSWYTVKTEDDSTYNARMKGIFKMDENITSTNPIAVGDWVEVAMENETENTVTITEILPRKNYVNRQSPRQKHHHHIIAANLDQSLLIVTLKEPRTSLGFIDRFLVVCEMYHVPATLVFNKTDIYQQKEWDVLAVYQSMYEALGYNTIAVSVLEEKNISPLREKLYNKTTLISGHSGVGKSSLINALLPDNERIKTQDVSGWSGKGMHTTTFATMYDIDPQSKIIDTPGIRELAMTANLEKEELSHYFPEMRERLNGCKYNNCLHINEPGCAIKEAVRQGAITEDRYVSYVNILDSIGNKGY